MQSKANVSGYTEAEVVATSEAVKESGQRAKHITVRYFFVREKVCEGELKI